MSSHLDVPAPVFTHLRRLTDAGGLYEHAQGITPRREHGYCLDDVARALVVTCREPGSELDDLREQYLGFVLAAQHPDGRFHNRRDLSLNWSDIPSVEDCWGRALCSLGAAAEHPQLRDRALAAFDRGARLRSPHRRAMAYAALGAADVLAVQPGHAGARALLVAAASTIGRPLAVKVWPWPELRLSYANALLPDALLAVGAALDAPSLVADGLGLLGWLLDRQTRDGHLSVVPVGGHGPGDAGPGFDQQPIEAAALAQACARAYLIAGRRRWAEGVELAVSWFLGANDTGVPLLDPATGGGFDGLHQDRRNDNQGAESTLALLTTLQQARALSAREYSMSGVTRTGVVLAADPSRVLARLFVPGHDLTLDARSRASGVLGRILALPEDEVGATLRRVLARYAGRHRDLPGLLRAHYAWIAHRVPDRAALTEQRRDLIGAWFTHEFAVEAAALFNPSVVAHPDQTGLAPGQCRFVLSLRAVGEGHLSSVEFRTGVAGPGQDLRVDDPGPQVEAGHIVPTCYDRDLFAALLAAQDVDRESAAFVIAGLPSRFDDEQLETALVTLTAQRLTRPTAARVGELARRLVAGTYEVEFPAASGLAERVLWPYGPAESRGIEDARFVRMEDDGSYRATYTAFDGQEIAPQLIETADFRRFRLSPLAGPAARNKGMALFPRRIGGRYVALSRWDRENNAVCTSTDGRWWGDPRTLPLPSRPWSLTQTGNCGSPVETDAGWVVLTHGVGPMREYAIGALLLDLQDPSRVLGALREPLLVPAEDERDGYVPNVVYSCGAMRLGDQLLLPYGCSDAAVRFAFVDLPRLVERLCTEGSPAAMRVNSSA